MVCGLGAAALLLSTLAGCGGEKGKKSGDGIGKKAADSAVVKVVVADVKGAFFQDWGDYSADLRGNEDAVLIAPYQGGRVNSVKPVGTRVKAGESLCDIDGDKYDAALEAAQAQVDVGQWRFGTGQGQCGKRIDRPFGPRRREPCVSKCKNGACNGKARPGRLSLPVAVRWHCGKPQR